MDKNRNAYALLILILIVSAALRFYGISWGTDPETGKFYDFFHPDERTVVEGAEWVGVDIRRAVTAYAKGPAYLLWALARGTGYLVGIEPFNRRDNRSVKFTHLVGRGISATLGVLTVWVVFAIGRHLVGIWTGVLSAAFLAFCAGHIQQSHYYTVDVSFAFWITLGIYLILKLPSDRTRPYLVCGMVCGMAAGTRLLGGMLGLAFLVAHLWPTGKGAGTGKIWEKVWHWIHPVVTPRALLCGATVIAVAVICEPLLLRPDAFFNSEDMRNFLPSVKVTKGEMIRIWVLYDFSTIPYLFYITHLFRYALGTPLEIAALCGVGLAVWKRERGWWVLLAWLVPYFLMVGGFHAKPYRYTTPMQPLMAVLGAWACVQAGDWLHRRLNRVWVYALPVVLVGVPAAAYGIATARIYRSSSRFEAARWVREHIPKGDGVLAERGGFSTAWMVQDRYKFRLDNAAFFIAAEGNIPYGGHIDFVGTRLAGMKWIVLIEENRMRQYMEVPKRYPIGHTFYRRLAAEDLGFKRVAHFKVSPEILGWEFSEADAEPTITAFDHPRVSVYQRLNANVKDLLKQWKADVLADPTLPDMYVKTGMEAYRRKDWEQAANAFRRTLDVRPKFTLGRLLLREVYLRQGRPDNAKRELRKVVSAGLSPRAYVGMIRVGMKAQGARYLESYVRRLAAKNPKDKTIDQYATLVAQVRVELGTKLKGQKQYEKAIVEYTGAIKLKPDYLSAHINLANLYLTTKRDNEAAAALERTVQLDSTRADVWHALAQTQQRIGNIEGAHTAIRKAIARDPSKSKYRTDLFNLGADYHKQGRFDKALAIYRETLAHNPKLKEAHVNIGLLRSDQGRHLEAIASFQKAIALSPDNLDAHLGLGKAYEHLKRHKEAIAAYRKVLSLDPDNARAKDSLDDLLQEKPAKLKKAP